MKIVEQIINRLKLTKEEKFDINLPKKKIELQQDVDYMIALVKKEYQRRLEESKKAGKELGSFELQLIIREYQDSIRIPEFIERLAEEFPEENIVPVLRDSLRSPNISDEEFGKVYEDIIKTLSEDMLCEQARKFGYSSIFYLPKSIPNHNIIVSAGIECDGFQSLELLKIDRVLHNRDLIIKAYEKDGIDRLSSYINYSLSPNRIKYKNVDGEMQHYMDFDKEYAFVQSTLKEDTTLHYILQKQEQLNKNQSSNSYNDENSISD